MGEYPTTGGACAFDLGDSSHYLVVVLVARGNLDGIET